MCLRTRKGWYYNSKANKGRGWLKYAAATSVSAREKARNEMQQFE
ncbi:hypothetical protein QNK12_30095 [Neobacillus cucumis]|nr:hypothetical protein QNK12_30095 [Neobacillus cucumis]